MNHILDKIPYKEGIKSIETKDTNSERTNLSFAYYKFDQSDKITGKLEVTNFAIAKKINLHLSIPENTNTKISEYGRNPYDKVYHVLKRINQGKDVSLRSLQGTLNTLEGFDISEDDQFNDIKEQLISMIYYETEREKNRNPEFKGQPNHIGHLQSNNSDRKKIFDMTKASFQKKDQILRNLAILNTGKKISAEVLNDAIKLLESINNHNKGSSTLLTILRNAEDSWFRKLG